MEGKWTKLEHEGNDRVCRVILNGRGMELKVASSHGHILLLFLMGHGGQDRWVQGAGFTSIIPVKTHHCHDYLMEH